MTILRVRRLHFILISLLLLAIAAPAAKPKPTAPPLPGVDRILVLKAKRELQLLSGGKVLKTYKIALGNHPVGPKERSGDHRTPEGIYKVAGHNAGSAYHLSLHISYPNADDVARAAKLHVSPGGDVMIHGLPNGYGWIGRAHTLHDWTWGCIAVTDEEIEEIYYSVADGIVVEIRP